MSDLNVILLEKYGPFMDLNELSCVLRIKKASMYQKIYNGQLDIEHVKMGKKYLFPTHSVAAYFNDNLCRCA
jgi:hypothetical protein